MSYLSGIRAQKIANLLFLTKNMTFVKNFLPELFARNVLPKGMDEFKCQIEGHNKAYTGRNTWNTLIPLKKVQSRWEYE